MQECLTYAIFASMQKYFVPGMHNFIVLVNNIS